MKIYNPFYPHIVKFDDGRFAVRRLREYGWSYLDAKDKHYWWCKKFVKNCTTDDKNVIAILEAAKVWSKTEKERKRLERRDSGKAI